eukprot:101588-Rhodomonas_salina.3
MSLIRLVEWLAGVRVETRRWASLAGAGHDMGPAGLTGFSTSTSSVTPDCRAPAAPSTTSDSNNSLSPPPTPFSPSNSESSMPEPETKFRTLAHLLCVAVLEDQMDYTADEIQVWPPCLRATLPSETAED